MDGLASRESAMLVTGRRRVSLEERKTEVVRNLGVVACTLPFPTRRGSAAPSHDRTTTGNRDAWSRVMTSKSLSTRKPAEGHLRIHGLPYAMKRCQYV